MIASNKNKTDVKTYINKGVGFLRKELEKNPEVFRKDINAINDELNDIITTREIKEESILNKIKTKEDGNDREI